MRGNGGEATTAAAEEAPKPVVTNPVVDRQITNVIVLYALYVMAMIAYVAAVNFSIDGPLWEAFAWTAGESLLFIIPFCAVLLSRSTLIRIYSEELPDDTGNDLTSNLLGHENV